MMKRIVAKNYRFASILGIADFRNVPVWVEAKEEITGKNFDQKLHDHELSGDVIQLLSREIAVRWYSQLQEGHLLTAKEIYGIQCIFGVKQIELATLLGITKGTISKLIKGSMKIRRPEAILCIELLKNELLRPGYVRARLEFRKESLPEAQLEPIYDFKKLIKKAA
jgi:hypothetical protein